MFPNQISALLTEISNETKITSHVHPTLIGILSERDIALLFDYSKEHVTSYKILTLKRRFIFG
jgi:hypothetical protein